MGKPTTTESSTDTKTGTSGETAIPIVPLNPDVATMGGGKTNTDTTSSTSTGITDKAGVTDKVWKPTALDEVKTEGAPGAGPTAPDYTVTTPDLGSSTTHKASEPAAPVKDAAKDTTSSTTTHSTTESKKELPGKHTVGSDVDAILQSTPKSKHTVDDAEANAPASHMTDKTVRQTEASHHGETGNSKSTWMQKTGHLLNSADGVAGLASEKTGAHNSSADRATSPASDEKSGKKMSALKEKLKDKLHIGSKDK